MAYRDCYYKHERKLVKHTIKIKGDNEVQLDDLGLLALTNEELRKQLHERGVQTGKGWTKTKLVQRLTASIHAEVVNDDQDPVEIDGTDDKEEQVDGE